MVPDKKCLHAALRLLSRRDHSCDELSKKLTQRGYEKEQIIAVMEECVRLNYLDDERYSHVYTRQLRRKGYGVLRITHMLRAKGVCGKLIDAGIQQHCGPESQLRDCINVLEKKLRNGQGRVDSREQKMKIFRFLNSRGFTPAVIQQALNVFDGSIS